MKEISKAKTYISGTILYLSDVSNLMKSKGQSTDRIEEQIRNLLEALNIINDLNKEI